MRTLFGILFIFSIHYAAELRIQVKPDTIYVGALTTLTISVKDLQKGDVPIFPAITQQPDIYLVVDRILSNHSADYILQFWEPGLISIPSIPVVLKRYKQEIITLQSAIIKIPVLSNIKENHSGLRSIKPMQELIFFRFHIIFISSLLLIVGILFGIYFWKSRKNSIIQKHHKGRYDKSIFNNAIQSLQSLQLPKNINTKTTEEYYLALSHICRTFIKEEYCIRATEMTSKEVEIYFQSISINHELISALSQSNKIADMAKYAGQIPALDQFKRDKEDFIHIIKSFHSIKL